MPEDPPRLNQDEKICSDCIHKPSSSSTEHKRSINSHEVAFREVVLVILALSVFFFPLTIYQVTSISRELNQGLGILLNIIGGIVLLCSWMFLYCIWTKCHKNCDHPNFSSTSEYKLKCVLPILSSIYFALILIFRTINGNCDDIHRHHDRIMIGDWSCNPYEEINMIPMDTAVILMGIPLMTQAIMKEECKYLLSINWSIVMIGMIFSACWLKSERSIPILICYGIGCAMILKEHQLDVPDHNPFESFHSLNDITTIAEPAKGKKVDEKSMNLAKREKEIRGMLANVAHDLKTPLSSFMTGVDIILRELHECAAHVPVELVQKVESMRACALNIRNTNSFMLMSINRCLDYAKASQGLKLTAKLETIDLKETLILPLSCMMNIQQKVKIILDPLSESICSHVVTDKQWLQENILCLLSNAVKYSSGGEVKIMVSLQSVSTQKIFHAKTQSTPQENEPVAVPLFQTKKTVRSSIATILDAGENSVYYSKEDNSTHDDEQFSHLEDRRQPYRRLSSEAEKSLRAITKAISELFTTRGSSRISPFPSGSFSVHSSHSSTHGSSNSRPFSLHVRSSVSTQRRGSTNSVSTLSDSHKRPDTLPDKDPEIPTEVLMFEIIDQGIGMTEEAMQSLFNPFKQTQKLAGGTGLGLYSLAKRIEALKGQYGVRARDDGQQGSVFWFSMPYRPDQIIANIAKKIHSDRHGSTKSRRRSMNLFSASTDIDYKGIMDVIVEHSNSGDTTVQNYASIPSATVEELHFLLAEDTLSIAKMTTAMLTKLGHKVTHAENGAVALKMLTDSYERCAEKKRQESIDEQIGFDNDDSTDFDVVLMDLQMPVMDGLEATRRLREYEKKFQEKTGKTIHQMVIGVTATDDEETFDEGFQIGIDDFMTKPFTMETFHSKFACFSNKFT